MEKLDVFKLLTESLEFYMIYETTSSYIIGAMRFFLLASFLVLAPNHAFCADQTVTSDSGSSGNGTLWNAITNVGSGESVTLMDSYTITYGSNFPTFGSKSGMVLVNAPTIMPILQNFGTTNSSLLYSSSSLSVSGNVSFENKPTSEITSFGCHAENSLTITSEYKGEAIIETRSTANAGSLGAAAFYSERGNILFEDGFSGNVTVDSPASRPAAGIYASKGIEIADGFPAAGSITTTNTASSGANGYAYGIRALNDGILFSNGNFSGTVRAISQKGTAATIRADDDVIFEGDFSESASLYAKSETNSAYGLQGDRVIVDENFAGDITSISLDSRAYGIYGSSELVFSKGVESTTTIKVDGNPGYGIYASSFDIQNGFAGSIEVDSDSSKGVGLYVKTCEGGLSGNGIITVSSTANQAFGIELRSGFQLGTGSDPFEIAENATIAATNQSDDLAVAIYSSSDSGSMNLYVKGTLSGQSYGDGKSYALFSEGEADEVIVFDSGANVSGDIDLGTGNDLLTFQDEGEAHSSVTNVKRIVKSGEGVWTVTGIVDNSNTIGGEVEIQEGTLKNEKNFSTPVLQLTGGDIHLSGSSNFIGEAIINDNNIEVESGRLTTHQFTIGEEAAANPETGNGSLTLQAVLLEVLEDNQGEGVGLELKPGSTLSINVQGPTRADGTNSATSATYGAIDITTPVAMDLTGANLELIFQEGSITSNSELDILKLTNGSFNGDFQDITITGLSEKVSVQNIMVSEPSGGWVYRIILDLEEHYLPIFSKDKKPLWFISADN